MHASEVTHIRIFGVEGSRATDTLTTFRFVRRDSLRLRGGRSTAFPRTIHSLCVPKEQIQREQPLSDERLKVTCCSLQSTRGLRPQTDSGVRMNYKKKMMNIPAPPLQG